MAISSRESTKIVQDFIRRYPSAKDGREAVLEHLATWNAELKFWRKNSLRTDVQELLSAAGVTQVRYIPALPVRGRLIPNFVGGKAVKFAIEVRADLPRESQRFTLAHEVSHTFFRRGVSFDVLPSTLDPEEEHLCDISAAELLVPRKRLERLLKKITVFTVEDLRRLASEFDVSVKCMMSRIVELRGDALGFVLHNVSMDGVNHEVTRVGGFIRKKHDIVLFEPERSQVVTAYDTRKSTMIEFQRFLVDGRDVKGLLCGSQPVDARRGNLIVTVLYFKNRLSNHKENRGDDPLFDFKSRFEVRVVTRQEFECLSCRGCRFVMIGNAAKDCACRHGLLIDTPGIDPIVIVFKHSV